MECRTPLYTIAPATNSVIAPVSPIISPTDRRSFRRANFDQQQPTQKPPQAEKIPIHLPKNHVLIALMETSNTQRNSSKSSSALVDNTDSDSDSDNDEFAVVSSMKALSAECGTYIIKERYGLPVYPENKDGSINTTVKPHTVLLHGQKVQVVGVKDGIYKLARGIGSIFASPSQIVKIDLPREKSCELEGMIHSIQHFKANLEKKLNNLSDLERNLQSDLHLSLRQPANYPVIEEVSVPSHQDDGDAVMKESRSTPTDKTISSSFQLSDDSMCTPTPATPPLTGSSTRERKTLYTEEIATPSSMQSRSASPLYNLGPMCGSSLFAPLRQLDDEDSSLRSAAQAVQNSFLNIRRSERSDFHDEGSVDFRTGLSGHVGLNNARKLKHRPTVMNRSTMRMMGEHRGISHIKNIRPKDPTSSPRVQNHNAF